MIPMLRFGAIADINRHNLQAMHETMLAWKLRTERKPNTSPVQAYAHVDNALHHIRQSLKDPEIDQFIKNGATHIQTPTTVTVADAAGWPEMHTTSLVNAVRRPETLGMVGLSGVTALNAALTFINSFVSMASGQDIGSPSGDKVETVQNPGDVAAFQRTFNQLVGLPDTPKGMHPQV